MCLVDTPGIGSVFAGNTETTREFIPQIDAAILVIGADPPISGEELALIEEVGGNVDEILIVLNKIDRVSWNDRREASAFSQQVLDERLQRPIGNFYEVSAMNRLNGTSDAGDFDRLAEELACRTAQAGHAMTSAAGSRGIARFSLSLQHAIAERIHALQQPIAESEERIAGLRVTAAEAEQSLRDLGALFSAEQMRLSNALLARRKEFLRGALPRARHELAQECVSIKTRFGPALRRDMMAKAQTVARRHVMPWLEEEEAQAEELYIAVTQRFVNQVKALLRQLADRQPGQYSQLSGQLETQPGFRAGSHFYFHDMVTVAQPASPLIYIGDVLLGAVRISYFFHRATSEFLMKLLDTNTSRVQGDVERRVVESRALLESQVRNLLREVSHTAEQALASARVPLESGSAAVQNELLRLESLKEEIALASSPE